MANQTFSTSLNLDDASKSGLANGEDITVDSGATLTWNSDNRWSQQAAVVGNITISATTGGEVLIDGRDVWWMAYDGGTGNVPSLGTVGTQNCTGGTSGATGEFLGIWTALGVAPSTAGGAMPATGFIKFRSKVGTFVDNETVTLPGGATIVVNSATGGERGWLSIVCEESNAVTVPRLGAFRIRGDWFQLGETNGTDTQTFQFPVADRCPAIQIETSPGSGIYEWWLNGGDRWGAAVVAISTDIRGTFFGDTTGGVVTIANRASNNCGYKPASGCKVRIPNVILSNTSSGLGWTTLSVNTTLGTRQEFVTTSAGVVDIEYACCNWYLNLVNPFSVSIKNTCWADTCVLSELGSALTIDNCASSFYTINGQCLTITTAYEGGTITDYRCVRRDSGSGSTQTIGADDFTNATWTRVRAEYMSRTTDQLRGNSAARCYSLNRCHNNTLQDCMAVGGGWNLQNTNGYIINNPVFCDLHNSPTSSTNATAAFSGTGNSNIRLTGFSNYAVSGVETHPYSSIFNCTSGQDFWIRNIGTSGSPYDGASQSSANGCAAIVVGGNMQRVKVQRCFGVRMRTAIVTDNNEDKGWTVANCYGDYADSRIVNGTNRLSNGIGETANTTQANASYGTHSIDYFTSATTGAVLFRGNESNAFSAAQCSITGTTRFDGGGGVSMPALNDSITWTTPRRILGHTAFQNSAPTTTGTNTTTNLTYEYQIDTDGSGYSAWKSLTAGNLSAETISPTTGFLLKVRATVSTANSGNLLRTLTILTTTTASDQLTLYPLNNPDVGYTGTLSGSTLSVWDDSSSALLATGSHSGSNTLAQPDWNADYTAVLRLRKPGYSTATYTGTVDEDGFTVPASQEDTAIADTDPGALGITITNHGATPVSWQSKDWSITITTTDDGLTAAQVANWINYNISQLATWNGFVGHAWPTMIEPDGAGFKTIRGRLFGSAGAALKGVRVVRSDGTTAVVGFTTMQADDGTTYTVPTYKTGTVDGFDNDARIVVYNKTTDTVMYDDIAASAPLTFNYLEGDDYTTGDEIEVFHVWYNTVDGASATKKSKSTAVAGASGWTVLISPEPCTTYAAYYATYSTTGQAVYASGDFVRDLANLQIDLDDGDDLWYAHRLFMFDKYDLYINSGRRAVFTQISAVDAANLSIGTLELDNLNANTAYQGDTISVTNATSTLPVVNPTTGGGGITMFSGGKVLTTSTGGIAPSEAQIKSWVRAELATEMARIDASITSRASAADQTAIKNLVEADEIHTGTTIEKRLRGTATPLLTKEWTGTPLSTFQAVDP